MRRGRKIEWILVVIEIWVVLVRREEVVGKGVRWGGKKEIVGV